jgi:hypothetical protein
MSDALIIALGNAGDQVRTAHQSQSFRIAAADGGDLPFQVQRLKGIVDRPPVEPAMGNEDVPGGGITLRCDRDPA